jgi:hypothetical protein
LVTKLKPFEKLFRNKTIPRTANFEGIHYRKFCWVGFPSLVEDGQNFIANECVGGGFGSNGFTTKKHIIFDGPFLTFWAYWNVKKVPDVAFLTFLKP